MERLKIICREISFTVFNNLQEHQQKIINFSDDLNYLKLIKTFSVLKNIYSVLKVCSTDLLIG